VRTFLNICFWSLTMNFKLLFILIYLRLVQIHCQNCWLPEDGFFLRWNILQKSKQLNNFTVLVAIFFQFIQHMNSAQFWKIILIWWINIWHKHIHVYFKFDRQKVDLYLMVFCNGYFARNQTSGPVSFSYVFITVKNS